VPDDSRFVFLCVFNMFPHQNQPVTDIDGILSMPKQEKAKKS
jgi:hypothetical protein